MASFRLLQRKCWHRKFFEIINEINISEENLTNLVEENITSKEQELRLSFKELMDNDSTNVKDVVFNALSKYKVVRRLIKADKNKKFYN